MPERFLGGCSFGATISVSITHPRAQETREDLVCALLLEKNTHCVTSATQRSLFRVWGTESPTLHLISLLNTVRHENQLDILDPHEGRGQELHTLIQTRFTPMEVSEFSSAWWSSGIDGDDVWTDSSFQAFRHLLPFLE